MMRLLACLIIVLLPAVLLAQAPATAPAPLAKELELAKKYAQFHADDALGNWEVLETLPTSKAGDDKKWSVEAGTLQITDEGMFLTATQGVGCFATVKGRTFKGPLGIRYEAMCPLGDDPSDLSVRFGPPNVPERIQFCVGAYQNTENSNIIGEARNRNLGGPLIVPGKWMTVECCFRGDEFSALLAQFSFIEVELGEVAREFGRVGFQRGDHVLVGRGRESGPQ